MMKHLCLALSLLALLAASCERSKTDQVKKEVNDVIDYATGGQAVKTMKNAEKKLEKIGKEQEKKLDDLLK